MADELTTTVNINFTKSGVPPISRTISETITVSGNHAGESAQDIGTGAENLVLPGDIATKGQIVFYNYGPTNYVEIGYDDTGFVAFFPIRVNEWAKIRLNNGTTYQARANTGAIRLGMIAVED
jgi:hypothetical protein